jgi:hypothetical protein
MGSLFTALGDSLEAAGFTGGVKVISRYEVL